ncbi:MAG: Lrp/AsnC family transcriptional regulator [Oscillospiraceae bacterium]|nr:Lrp/AsnC family transcriptional regulator [Oscillospiraceae bacterium]
MNQILNLLAEDASLSIHQLAVMTGKSEEEVKKEKETLEDAGIIKGYRAVIDWDKTEKEDVTALIEIRVSPKAHLGFDEIARQIASFEEVESVFLMSGSFDLCATVVGKSLKEVAFFVSGKLGVMDSVLSCATHFILKKYKDSGISFGDEPEDERGRE